MQKFTGEHACRRVISIKLLWNFVEIRFRNGCSPVNLLHISKTLCLKNTSGGLLLNQSFCYFQQMKQLFFLQSVILYIWVKVFKNGPSKTCGRQSLKNVLQIFKGCLPQILLGPFLNTFSHI